VVAAALHWVRSSALDESIETPNPDGSSRSEQLMNELLVRFPNNIDVLAYHLDLASFRGDEVRVTELLAMAPPRVGR